MDVQPVDAGAAVNPPPLPAPAPVATTYDPGPVAIVTPAPQVTSAPASAPRSSTNGSTDFTNTASQIFGSGNASSSAAANDVTVSIRVAQDPNQIITVFRDAEGNVIQQVPSEVVVRLAEFFDQQLGALLDRNA
jgi:hypothetical protein